MQLKATINPDGSITEVEDATFVLPPESQTEIVKDKWLDVGRRWEALTVTSSSGHTFSANANAIKMIQFKAMNMGDSAVILWEEPWGSFNTNIVELKEVLNLAADAHQTIINSVFGV